MACRCWIGHQLGLTAEQDIHQQALSILLTALQNTNDSHSQAHDSQSAIDILVQALPCPLNRFAKK